MQRWAIAMEYKNIVELARASVARFADRPLFGERDGRSWKWTTFAGWQRHVDALRSGLAALGIGAGDRIAIVSRNCTAWATAAYASYGLGATFVPMYESQRPDEWELILRDSGAVCVFGRTPAIVSALDAMRDRLPALRHVVAMEGGDVCSMAALEALGATHPVEPVSPEPGDIAGLVYTSGTTGLPKGAMLTHHNLTSTIESAMQVFPLSADDRTVSFLPWAHIYGQLCELHILVAIGGSTAFNTDIEHLADDLRAVKPTLLVAVPRVFSKIHAAVRAEIATKSLITRVVFERGMTATIRRRRGERLSLAARIWCWLAGFMFAAIRRKLGGRLTRAITGSATQSPEVAEFIDALGVEVYEGYGLTETTAAGTLNLPGKRKFGSVGRVVPGHRIELDATRSDVPGEGEIVLYGPAVMKGYHARPDENARAFTADGGLRTGDLGRFDADGYLYITGRIKEQFKLENGKYVMPAPLEEKLALSPYVRNVMIHGAGRLYNVALVVVDGVQLRRWAAEHDYALASDIVTDPHVRELIRGELERLGTSFRSYERPRDFVLSQLPFTIENGLLTPTLKLKRREAEARFRTAFDELYAKPWSTDVARLLVGHNQASSNARDASRRLE